MDEYGLKNNKFEHNEKCFQVCCQMWTLSLEESFQGTWFGHVFSKACQYATSDEKVYKGLKYVSIKFTQVYLEKCITYPKKLDKDW